MKLALVISSLGGGGAERVMTVLANAWASGGDRVTVITLASEREDKYRLDPAVRRIALGVTGASGNVVSAMRNNFVRVRRLRGALRASVPEAVISFVTRTNLLTIVAARGLGVPVIVSERTFLPSSRWVHGIWRLVNAPLYRRADGVVVQTRRGAAEMESVFGRATSVIPNPLSGRCDADVAGPAARESDGRRTLLAVGRLAPEKGFDVLIEAFSRVADRHPDWNLRIIGEGPLREPLAQQTAAAGLAGRVALPGFDPCVREAMRRADLFALSSSFEGFPNALLEAMAEGAACVSFDCYAGPRELIEHGVNGWLVPEGDTGALAEALDRLMGDPDLRAQLGTRAREVCDVYAPSAVISRWNALLASITGGRVLPVTEAAA